MMVKEGYKDSSLGIIPKSWDVIVFDKLFERITRKNKDNNDNILSISAQDGLVLQKEYFNKNVSSKDTSHYYLIRNGEFAYNKSYSEGYPFGAIKRLDDYQEGVLSTLYICFKIKSDKIFSDFYKQLFESNVLKKEILSISKEGSRNHGLLNIKIKDFFNINVPVPPKKEQKKIADILSSVDETIEKTDQVIEKTKELKKGLMQQLLTKGIGHDEFKEVRLGAKTTEIPKVWSVQNIDTITSKVQYGISDKMYLDGEYPIFRMNNFKRGYMVSEPMKYINLSKEEFEKYKVEKGDILFNRTNSVDLVGKNGIFDLEGDYVFASYLIRLRTNKKCYSHFLNFYLNSYIANSILDSIATRGASQANINAKNLKAISVPLPPLEEQKKIANILSTVDEKIQKEKEYKEKLEELKNGLMQKLLTGEVRVKVAN